VVRGLVTVDLRAANNELRAMSEAVTTSGGYLVPEQMGSEVIDKARNNSAVMRAGARTVPMESDVLTFARIAADASFALKGENAAFTESAPTIDAITFTAKTFGCVVRASRELAEDAPNFGGMITDSLAAALAVELDRLSLVGSGSATFDGLQAISGVNAVTAVGTPATYAKWMTGIQNILNANGKPNAVILCPRDAVKLGGLLDTTNQPMQTPPLYRDLLQLVTTSLPVTEGAGANESSSYIGDFTQLWWGVRDSIRVEVSTEEGDSFQNHQVAIKCWFRGAFNCAHANHFTRLSGILA
ncbi:MAG: phage major capsid protein, partial [Gammaproteobacteria bacterium]